MERRRLLFTIVPVETSLPWRLSSKIQLDATSYQQHHFLIRDKIYRCFSDATFFLLDATGVTYSTLFDAMNRFPSFAFLCGFARIFCRTFGTLIYLANLLCRDYALRASSPAYALSSFQDFFESQKFRISKTQKVRISEVQNLRSLIFF